MSRQAVAQPDISLQCFFLFTSSENVFLFFSVIFFFLKQSQKPKEDVLEVGDPKTEAVKSMIKTAGYYLVVKQYGLFSVLCQ